jgi:hypothetical protein
MNDIENFSTGEAPIDVLRDFIYSAFADGCRVSGKEKDFTKEDVGDWMDEDKELFNKIVGIFVNKSASEEKKS